MPIVYLLWNPKSSGFCHVSKISGKQLGLTGSYTEIIPVINLTPFSNRYMPLLLSLTFKL